MSLNGPTALVTEKTNISSSLTKILDISSVVKDFLTTTTKTIVATRKNIYKCSPTLIPNMTTDK